MIMESSCKYRWSFCSSSLLSLPVHLLLTGHPLVPVQGLETPDVHRNQHKVWNQTDLRIAFLVLLLGWVKAGSGQVTLNLRALAFTCMAIIVLISVLWEGMILVMMHGNINSIKDVLSLSFKANTGPLAQARQPILVNHYKFMKQSFESKKHRAM